jgi:hypothetical protein
MSYPIPFYTVLCYTVLCCGLSHCPVQSCPALPCPVLTCPILSCATLCCAVFSSTSFPVVHCTVLCCDSISHSVSCCTVVWCAAQYLLPFCLPLWCGVVSCPVCSPTLPGSTRSWCVTALVSRGSGRGSRADTALPTHTHPHTV